jgi:SPP1 gp7 family putative phage head morphogenesis protein
MGFPFEPNKPVPPGPAAPKALPAPVRAESIASGTSCYTILSLADDPTLTAIQAELRSKYPDPAIQWEKPDEFHVTLVFVPEPGDVGIMTSVLPKSINPLVFQVGPIGTFERTYVPAEQQPIFLYVERTPALQALQAGLAESFRTLAYELSEYSDPANWQPHITLGYMPVGMGLPEYNETATVSSASVICSIDTGQGEHQTIYVTRAKDDIAVQMVELDNWQNKVRHKGPAANFTIATIPDRIVQYVRSELADGWNPGAVFAEARAAMRQNRDPRAQGATPEEAQQYWQHFDDLQVDIGESWAQYMTAVSADVFEGVVERQDTNIDDALSSHHAALINDWVGTLEKPGPLLALVLAGMQAGDKALEREIAANPHKPARSFGVGVSFDLLSQEALDYARNYGFGLIRRIDDTTRGQIRDAVAKHVEEGQTIDQLRDAIAQTLIPPDGEMTQAIRERALLIAQTESDRAFVNGSFQRWRSAGVTDASWETVRDNDVCKVCKSLHGKVARFDEGWYSDVSEKTYTDQAHPRDRCFRRPKVA